MNDSWPKILASKRTAVSPWLDVIAREVQFSQESPVDSYYAIGQPDYAVALAVTPSSRVLLVRQYRPAIERFSLELPAGMIDRGEDPSAAVTRELLEETGYPSKTVELIGKNATCSSRISNWTYSYFVRTGERRSDFREEPGVAVSTVSLDELRTLVVSGELSEQTHVGALMLATARRLISL
jgi:ADP-ribose pyrophosphatase